MTKDEIFAINMRALGYKGTDREFSDLACLLRMTVRLGIDKVDLPTEIVKEIWADMLDRSPVLV